MLYTLPNVNFTSNKKKLFNKIRITNAIILLDLLYKVVSLGNLKLLSEYPQLLKTSKYMMSSDSQISHSWLKKRCKYGKGMGITNIEKGNTVLY